MSALLGSPVEASNDQLVAVRSEGLLFPGSTGKGQVNGERAWSEHQQFIPEGKELPVPGLLVPLWSPVLLLSVWPAFPACPWLHGRCCQPHRTLQQSVHQKLTVIPGSYLPVSGKGYLTLSSPASPHTRPPWMGAGGQCSPGSVSSIPG